MDKMTPANRAAFNPELIEQSLNMGAVVFDDATRSAEFSVSSETPVLSLFLDRGEVKPCYQILEHSEQAVDLSRFQDGSPLLVQHDQSQQVGVIERAWLDSSQKRLMIKTKFSRSQQGQRESQDVADGIRRNVSIGARVIKRTVTSESIDGLPVVRIQRWQPREASLVSIPADYTVGINRQDEADPVTTPAAHEERTESPMPSTEEATPPPAVDVDKIRRDEREAIQRDMVEFQTIARSYGKQFDNMDELLDKALERSITPSTFKSELGERLLERGAKPVQAQSTSPDGLPGVDAKEYSLMRAIKAQASGDWRGAEYERDVSDTLARTLDKSAGGFLVPYAALDVQRDVGKTGSGATGSNLVARELLSGSFIDLLRNRSSVTAMGATMLTGLVGDIDIPRQTSSANAAWVGERGSTTESAAGLDKVAMTPKTVTAYSEITRKMLKQGDLSVEMLVRNDLAKTLSLAIDYAALNGSGSGNQPRGILQTSGIGAVVGGTNGLAPTFQHFVDLETETAIDNADVGNLGYVINAKARGYAKKTPAFANTDRTIWEPGNTLNGYKTAVSNQVPSNLTKGTSSGVCSAILFGNFADLMVGMWGVLDIIANPFALDTQGGLRLTVLQDVDVAVRHAESFAAMLDALV